MAGKLPKVEGLIVLSSSYQLTITEVPAANATVTVATAGNYYLTSATSLLTTVANALTSNGTLAGTYSLSIDDDSDTSTGKVTISATGITSFSISWAPGLQDLFGFTGTQSGAASYTGANQCRYLWLPSCGRRMLAPEPASTSYYLGVRERDGFSTLSPSGYHVNGSYNTRYRDTFEFPMLTGNKVWIANESTTNESFEKFYQDVVGLGYQMRYHSTRDDDALFWTVYFPDFTAYVPEQFQEGWVGPKSLWRLKYEMRPHL